jgi:hypothetical protein
MDRPEPVNERAAKIRKGMLPSSSAARYEEQWDHFCAWKLAAGIPEDDVSEDTLLVYFSDLSSLYAASSLWSKFSMINKQCQVVLFSSLLLLTPPSCGTRRKSTNMPPSRRFSSNASRSMYQ